MALSFPKTPPVWWGAPKKFDPNFEERRISWLELFYDLVYVIAISRITHHLCIHISWNGFLEYAGLFTLIFWGWLNGSLYYDIHGSIGLRTRLMTLWQVMIIAALSVTIDDHSAKRLQYITIVLMIMQFYVTYLWWSVGFYDKPHRRYSRPYTTLYLLSFALMGFSIYYPDYLKFILPLVIIFNYSPPFIAQQLLRRASSDMSLSSSMSERLGLFTIIVFGEVVLGVVNGVSKAGITQLSTWIDFALILGIIFALWWIFFTMISNRNAKKSFNVATLLELLFIPTLISLGLMAACLNSLFDTVQADRSVNMIVGYSLASFLSCISLIMGLLVYPDEVRHIIKRIRVSLFITSLIFWGWSLSGIVFDLTYDLLVCILVLIVQIIYMNYTYYSLGLKEPGSEN